MDENEARCKCRGDCGLHDDLCGKPVEHPFEVEDYSGDVTGERREIGICEACWDAVKARRSAFEQETAQEKSDREGLYRAACEWDSMRAKGSLEPRMKPLPGKGNKKPSLDGYDHRRK